MVHSSRALRYLRQAGVSLYQVIHRSQHQALPAEPRLAEVAEDDHRNILQIRHQAQPLQHLDPAQLGKLQVEINDTGHLGLSGYQSCLAVQRDADGMPIRRQVLPIHLGQHLVVLDDKHARRAPAIRAPHPP